MFNRVFKTLLVIHVQCECSSLSKIKKIAIEPYFQPVTFNFYGAHFNVMLFYTFYPNYVFKDSLSLCFLFAVCSYMPHSHIF
jgi:hypothetical protein